MTIELDKVEPLDGKIQTMLKYLIKLERDRERINADLKQ